MKLGVTYIVFDGSELLEYTIRQIRPHVDYINVVYQEVSWFGVPLAKEDLNILRNLKNSALIDELILFKGFFPLKDITSRSIMTAKRYETEKRQFGLNLCLKQKCTHYLCMDVDEFYESNEFLNAKKEIISSGYDSTAVRFINYVNIPTLHRGFDANRVPFICKISRSSKMGSKFFVKCDPTRGISDSHRVTHEFSPNLIKMHHMETVRRNLHMKYGSTTRAIFNRSKTEELVKSIRKANANTHSFNFNKIIFPGMKSVDLTHSENLFSIPYSTWNT